MTDNHAPSADCVPTFGALYELLLEHRPNYVTEGVPSTTPSLSTQRTRVRCEGNGCDFLAIHANWYVALDRHTEHLTEVLTRVLTPEGSAS